MSIAAALRRIAEIVETIPPACGQRMLWLDPDHGDVRTLESAHEGPDRLFELSAVTVADDGEGGCIPARLRVTAQLRIRYRLAGSRQGRQVQQAEDVAAIRDALTFDPTAWVYSTTRILTVDTGPSLPPSSALPPGATEPVHEIVTIPLTLEVDRP